MESRNAFANQKVAIDPERKRLYVVGERDGHLYTYKIREEIIRELENLTKKSDQAES